MPLANWFPPNRVEPSKGRKGESNTDVIYHAVGRALSQWEMVESACVKLFQLVCESPSLAVCRAYGTIISGAARVQALEAAATEFFRRQGDPFPDDFTKLIRAIERAGGYRNKIAHGIACGCHDVDGEHLGYYHMPASYAARHRGISIPTERWWLAADYFYLNSDIDNCRDRFEALVSETMRIALYLNGKYDVLFGEEFHP